MLEDKSPPCKLIELLTYYRVALVWDWIITLRLWQQASVRLIDDITDVNCHSFQLHCQDTTKQNTVLYGINEINKRE